VKVINCSKINCVSLHHSCDDSYTDLNDIHFSINVSFAKHGPDMKEVIPQPTYRWPNMVRSSWNDESTSYEFSKVLHRVSGGCLLFCHAVTNFGYMLI